jgi:maltodextrin utilization protein YvdJ
MHSTSHTMKSKANPNENQMYYTHTILNFYNQSDFFVSVHTYLLMLPLSLRYLLQYSYMINSLMNSKI